uniref:RING-type domain-containing protein n=1 Tax=Trichuris muris TaxID=70415 RepID=A0A5S6QGX4_TRIMR
MRRESYSIILNLRIFTLCSGVPNRYVLAGSAMFFKCNICEWRCSSGELSLLPCGHGFHNTCVTRLIKNLRRCPTCGSRASSRSITEKVYFTEVEQTEEEASSHEECVRLAKMLGEKEKQHKRKIDECIKKRDVMERKLVEAMEQLDTSKRSARSLPKLEKENCRLKMEIAKVNKENRRMKRLLQLEDNIEIASDAHDDGHRANDLINCLHVLSKEYVDLKKKSANILKKKLYYTREIALAKRDAKRLNEAVDDELLDHTVVPPPKRTIRGRVGRHACGSSP